MHRIRNDTYVNGFEDIVRGVATRVATRDGNLSEMGHYELKALSSSTGQRCSKEGLARKRGPR